MTDDARAAVRTDGLTRIYGSGEARVTALDGVDLVIHSGQFTAIMGPSGSGKSTLMHCAAGLDRASAGRVWLGGTEISTLPDRALTRLRRDRVGFVFQAFNLLPTLSAWENITLPLELAGRKVDQAMAERMVDTLGLADHLDRRPDQLSGGQQQRVACARALITRPEVVFADEPTGNLDTASSAEVLGFLRAGADELGQTVVLVTHDPAAAGYADRVLFLSDGRVVGELLAPTTTTVLEAIASIPAVSPR